MDAMNAVPLSIRVQYRSKSCNGHDECSAIVYLSPVQKCSVSVDRNLIVYLSPVQE